MAHLEGRGLITVSGIKAARRIALAAAPASEAGSR